MKVQNGTVVLQARVDAEFARALIEEDAKTLGLATTSDVVREGLRLLHRHAREQAAAAAYDDFYAGGAAPLPDGIAAEGA